MKKIAKPIMELSNISRSDRKSTIERLTLSVPDGDSYGVLCKSESNITLLTEILSGRISPKKGKVFFKGDDVTGVKNVFGVVQKEPSAPKRKTVAEAAAASIVKRGLPRELAGVLVKKELASLGLYELGEKRFSELSALDAAKAQIFCAYMCSHEFMAIHEPFSELSEGERDQAVEWLTELKTSAKMSLLTFTQDIPLAMKLSDYVMVADKNTSSAGIIAIEKGKEDLARQRLEELFAGV